MPLSPALGCPVVCLSVVPLSSDESGNETVSAERCQRSDSSPIASQKKLAQEDD